MSDNPPDKFSAKIKTLPGGELTLLICIFLLAFLFRLIYILQISRAPYFDNPIGDSLIYYNRALDILKGDFWGKEIFFHSSPPYPYFMAILFFFSGHSFFFLYLVQILIGSGNCILIYYLAKKLSDNRISPALIAGLFAALYGLLAFFDEDVLMIFLTLFCVDLSLLLLLKYIETERVIYASLAGIAYGMGVLDKPNLLIFVPVALFFLLSRFSLHPLKWHWKPVILYLIALFLIIFPVTLRNYLVGKDFVLISSNGGVNFYIGNNPRSLGVFRIPSGSGLADPGLYESSVTVAEKETGKKLKPSEVSHFWANKAWESMKTYPLISLKLFSRKFLLLFNYYEIPNHLNYYFIQSEFAPILGWMPIGFWLVFPLALVGIIWKIKTGMNLASKLFISFLVCYAISLLPFFITERYRLPMIPIYIAFASVALVDFYDSYRKNEFKPMLFQGVVLLLACVLTFLPFRHFKYSFDRIAIACKYPEQANQDPARRTELLNKAITEFKWALESDPSLPYAYFDLGLAYESLGFYSGSSSEYTQALAVDPNYLPAQEVLKKVVAQMGNKKDLISQDEIPKSLYEQTQELEKENQIDSAIKIYQYILLKDPFHYPAMNHLGMIYFQRGEYSQAARYFKKGLKIKPDEFDLLDHLGDTYFKIGNKEKARELWNLCLELQPDNQKIRQKL